MAEFTVLVPDYDWSCTVEAWDHTYAAIQAGEVAHDDWAWEGNPFPLYMVVSRNGTDDVRYYRVEREAVPSFKAYKVDKR